MEMEPCIMKSKIVSTAVVGLEPWVSSKLNELLGSKDDTARNIFFSVDNICIELSLYAVAVRFLDFRFFLL